MCSSFDNDATTEDYCGDTGPCSSYYRDCRCLGGCESDTDSVALQIDITGWTDDAPSFRVTDRGGSKTTFTRSEGAQSAYCLGVNWDKEENQFGVTLAEYVEGSCRTEALDQGSFEGLPSSGGMLTSIFLTVAASDDGPSTYEDFINTETDQCAMGDVSSPEGSGKKYYKMAGGYNCGFNFENIILDMTEGADFTFVVQYSTTISCSYSNCPNDVDFEEGRVDYLVPRVSCVHPCHDGRCFVSLGYTNSYPTEILQDGSTEFTDMGYKFIPPYYRDGGSVNIMYPSSCADLKANPKFIDDDGVFRIFDSTSVEDCDVDDNEFCSLYNYVVSYRQDPSGLWGSDDFKDMEIMKYWREQFGWDYESGSPSADDSLAGFVGFRMQPMFFAPGRHDGVSIMPVDEDQELCWTLGNVQIDICTTLDCRKTHSSLGCSTVTGDVAIYSYFYTNLRLGQESGYSNFQRFTNTTVSSFQFDNAYQFTFSYQFEQIAGSAFDSLEHLVFPLPSPCMVDYPNYVFYMSTYEADCSVHSKPPCPGGYCAPVISRLSEPSLRTPLQVAGSGCTSADCPQADGGPTVGSDEGDCQCAYVDDGTGGWETEGTCRELTCMDFDDSGTFYSDDRTWLTCASPSGFDPMRVDDRVTFTSMRNDPSCGCAGIQECPQSELLTASDVCGENEIFSPQCTIPTSLSGNAQKSLWALEFCHGDSNECGPTLPVSSGEAGCTDDWVDSFCQMKTVSYQYTCAGSDLEQTTCRYINTNNYNQGVANDIRDVVVPGTEYMTFQVGQTSPTGLTANNDPDADNVLGWTSRFFCLTTEQESTFDCSTRCNSDGPISTARCALCGNGICETAEGESCLSCARDCASGQTTDMDGLTTGFCCGYDDYGCGSGCSSGDYECTTEECDGSTSIGSPSSWCLDNRIPLEIVLENSDEVAITEACGHFELDQAICAFESEQECITCGAGDNDGCGDDEACNLQTCECESGCEKVGSGSNPCSGYDAECQVGQQRCVTEEECEPVSCLFLGTSACCVDCENTYSNSLVDIWSTECDSSLYPCCPSGYYPVAPERCECTECTEYPDEDDSCICGRCEEDEMIPVLASNNLYSVVSIDRYNPYGCECLECSTDTLDCAFGTTIFPPPYILRSTETQSIVMDWLQEDGNTCPTCTSCEALAEAGMLFDDEFGLCESPFFVARRRELYRSGSSSSTRQYQRANYNLPDAVQVGGGDRSALRLSDGLDINECSGASIEGGATIDTAFTPTGACFAEDHDSTSHYSADDVLAFVEIAYEENGGRFVDAEDTVAHVRVTLNVEYVSNQYGDDTPVCGEVPRELQEFYSDDHILIQMNDEAGESIGNLKICYMNDDSTDCSTGTVDDFDGPPETIFSINLFSSSSFSSSGSQITSNSDLSQYVIAASTSMSRNANDCGYENTEHCCASDSVSPDYTSSDCDDPSYTPDDSSDSVWEFRAIYDAYIDTEVFGLNEEGRQAGPPKIFTLNHFPNNVEDSDPLEVVEIPCPDQPVDPAVDTCKCLTCSWYDLDCNVEEPFPTQPDNPSWIDQFRLFREDYLECFASDPFCDHQAGYIRDGTGECACAPCECPDDYVLPLLAEACDMSECVPCEGKTQGDCSSGERLVDSTGRVVNSGDPYCGSACDLCTCDPCPDYSCETSDGATPDQYDWYVQEDSCDNDCVRCLDFLDCPSMGMAFDTSYTHECRCRPCVGDCDLYFIVSGDSTCEYTTTVADWDYWTEDGGELEDTVESSACTESGTDATGKCLSNDGTGSCAGILEPDGTSCTQSSDSYNFYWLWNRLQGACGESIKLRYPSSTMTGDDQPALWKITPSFDNGFPQVEYRSSATTTCTLPDRVPDGFGVVQVISTSPTTYGWVSRLAGTNVAWDEVSYSEWMQAYVIGLIDSDCMAGVGNFGPVSNLDVFDARGRTVHFIVHTVDMNQNSDGDLLYTNRLANPRRGVWKANVLGVELPPGHDEVGCTPDYENGLACSENVGSNDLVGSNRAGSYLMMWLQIVCESGLGGYVWDEVVNLCPHYECGDLVIDAASMDSTMSADVFRSPFLNDLYFSVSWTANAKCHPAVRAFVDGEDGGNNLNVSLGVDGFELDCSDVCIEDGDGGYEATGDTCWGTVNVVDSYVDRRWMISSCGGASVGGGSSWTVRLGTFSELPVGFDNSLNPGFTAGDRDVNLDFECSGFIEEEGLAYVVDSDWDQCACTKRVALESCEPRCGTQFSADKQSCVCCEELTVGECQSDWKTEECPPGTRFVDFSSDEDAWVENGCSNCVDCSPCSGDDFRVGVCDFIVANDVDCGFTETESCPDGQVVQYDDSDSPIRDEDGCPVCVDPSVYCPCKGEVEDSSDDYFTVFVFVWSEDFCGCAPQQIAKNIPNFTFVYAEQGPDCNGTVTVVREPCVDCADDEYLTDPADTCSCAPCDGTNCEAGVEVQTAGDPCECRPCTCTECRDMIFENHPDLCEGTPDSCLGCAVTDVNGDLVRPSGGSNAVCDLFLYCDPDALCADALLQCPDNCTAYDNSTHTHTPITLIQDWLVDQTCAEDRPEPCSPDDGYCVSSACTCPDDCQATYDSGTSTWYVCDDSALCNAPVACTSLGYEDCDGVTPVLRPDGNTYILFPKDPVSFSDRCDASVVCECEEVVYPTPSPSPVPSPSPTPSPSFSPTPSPSPSPTPSPFPSPSPAPSPSSSPTPSPSSSPSPSPTSSPSPSPFPSPSPIPSPSPFPSPVPSPVLSPSPTPSPSPSPSPVPSPVFSPSPTPSPSSSPTPIPSPLPLPSPSPIPSPSPSPSTYPSPQPSSSPSPSPVFSPSPFPSPSPSPAPSPSPTPSPAPSPSPFPSPSPTPTSSPSPSPSPYPSPSPSPSPTPVPSPSQSPSPSPSPSFSPSPSPSSSPSPSPSSSPTPIPSSSPSPSPFPSPSPSPVPCTCGSAATDDCTPFFDVDGHPQYCDPSANYNSFCNDTTYPCPDCDFSSHKYKNSSEVVDICDISEICECVACTCPSDCEPIWNATEMNWYYCNTSTLCDDTVYECATCEDWGVANNVTFDPDFHFYENRSEDYPATSGDLCTDPCECVVSECVQECSPRLGQNTTATPCGPCDTCDCPPEWKPVGLLPFIALGTFFGTSVEDRCSGYWDQLVSQGYELAYEGEQNDVDIGTLCELVDSDRGTDCSCIVSLCDCAECEECKVCPENAVGPVCRDGPTEGYYDEIMYYRNESACQESCVQCPDPCVPNATHVLHRQFEKCSQAGAECYGVDLNENDCSNQVSVCNDPCNCDLAIQCVPVFSEDDVDDEERYCDGITVQHNRTLTFDDISDDGTWYVQCDECIPCECDDAVCGANSYVDPNYVCGQTTDFMSCGKRKSVNGPCSCAGDTCEPCVECPEERVDIWLGVDLNGNDIYGSTVCYHGTYLLPEDEWQVASQCIESNCTDAAKVDEICQCNCVECVEEDYIRALCDANPSLLVPACSGPTEDLTCNSYYQETYRSDYYFSWNATSCSCEYCGETDLSHLPTDCDPYAPQYSLTPDGCGCMDCDGDTEDPLCCPPQFAGCDSEAGERLSSTYCECEPCEDNCDICSSPVTSCEEDGYFACEDKSACPDGQQPEPVSCVGYVGIIADCVNETDYVRDKTCYTTCQNCTGDFCVDLVDGTEVYRDRLSSEIAVEGSPCTCETCPTEYECPDDLTPVTLADITLPESLQTDPILNQLPSIFYGIYGEDTYWALRCNETCIPCTENICSEIAVTLGLEDVLLQDPDDPCTCIFCPYEFVCPDCPWCDATVDDCPCTAELNEEGTILEVVCPEPPQCNGNPVGDCDVFENPMQGSPDDSSMCYWSDEDASEPTALDFNVGKRRSDCTCRYEHPIPPSCPTAVENCTQDYEICDPLGLPCFCNCIDPCPVLECPTRECQVQKCNETCVPCPDCPPGEYIRDEIIGFDQTSWLCDSEESSQCDCVSCPYYPDKCPVGSYLDETACECVYCPNVVCNQGDDYDGENLLEVYIYPDEVGGNCSCSPCLDSELGCGYDCGEENCHTVAVENNVCTCEWCLPDKYADAAFDAYGPEDCDFIPVYDFDTDAGSTDYAYFETDGDDTDSVGLCKCGLKGTGVTVVPPPIPEGPCPYDEVCGCCPDDYLRCVEAGNSDDACRDLLCLVLTDCDGNCSGEPLEVDDCGVLCGDGTSCIDDVVNVTITVCLISDLCGVCGGDGSSCAGCDGVPGSGKVNGVDCETGEIVCDGTQEGDCPAPVGVVVTASVVGGAVSAAAIIAAATASFFVVAAILRKGHMQSQIAASYEDIIEEQITMLENNPLHQGAQVTIQVDLGELADVDID